MLVRAVAVVLVLLAVASGCGTDCSGLSRQMTAIVSGPSRCVDDSDCGVFVGLCDIPQGECGVALDAADGERLDQLQHQYIDAACPTNTSPGSCACRAGTHAGAATCSNGACACANGACLVSTTM